MTEKAPDDMDEVVELSPDDIDAHIEGMALDLERGTQCLSDEAADRVLKARGALLHVIGILTGHVPPEPSTEYTESVWKACKSAMLFRNVIRAEFLKAEGHDLPGVFWDPRPEVIH